MRMQVTGGVEAGPKHTTETAGTLVNWAVWINNQNIQSAAPSCTYSGISSGLRCTSQHLVAAKSHMRLDSKLKGLANIENGKDSKMTAELWSSHIFWVNLSVRRKLLQGLRTSPV